MSRLLDKILGYKAFYNHIPSEMIREGLPLTTVFNITNIFDYWLANEDLTVHPQHFPNCAPVLNNMFFEMFDKKEQCTWGVLVVSTEYKPGMHTNVDQHYTTEPRWLLISYPFAEQHGKFFHPLPLVWTACVAADGRVLEFEDEKGCMLSIAYADERMGQPITDEDMELSSSFYMYGVMCPVFLALSFMHCKNVQQTAHRQSRPERRRLLKEGRQREAEALYYTLEIDPMKKVLRDEGHIESVGLKRALHITRGHFAEYGPEFNKGKLFGKLEGRYWIPQHVKGSAELGEVKKDYRVLAPK